MKPAISAVAMGLALATTAFAHSGVKDPAVKARMDSMGILGAQTKVLGQMARGITEFDADRARAAIEVMQGEADRTPELFELAANDPKSEALPSIWRDWAAFENRADALSAVLAGADVSTEIALAQTLGQIGGACKACHQDFRE